MDILLLPAEWTRGMLKIPQCEVVEVREVEGPRGGKMLVMKLACGNLI